MNGCAIYEFCTVNYCANPECPNFGLYQFSLEEMINLIDKKYKILEKNKNYQGFVY